MAPSRQSSHQVHNNEDTGPSQRSSRVVDGMASSVDAASRLRNEESWVEISSQPSSSSISSIDNEIVTTGLRVQPSSPLRRTRRLQPGPRSRPTQLSRHHTSSQEEYEESESEEDHILTSSNEHLPALAQFPVPRTHVPETDSDNSEDESSTALGLVAGEPIFTPQPNAFSHPSSGQTSHRRNNSNQSIPDSYFPRTTNLSSHHQHPHHHYNRSSSYPTRSSRPTHTPYTALSPTHQADNDAALRASLTTLLSCAAAARGLPKRNQSTTTTIPTRGELTSLRLIPESELLNPNPAAQQRDAQQTQQHQQPHLASLSTSPRPRSPPSISSTDAEHKRKSPTAASTSQHPKPTLSRAAKKKKITTTEAEVGMVSPTLLTWVMSAGVVVLVSVVGFGAGYVLGYEVGRSEAGAGMALAEGGTGCAREVGRGAVGGLRRFRLGGRGSGIVA